MKKKEEDEEREIICCVVFDSSRLIKSLVVVFVVVVVFCQTKMTQGTSDIKDSPTFFIQKLEAEADFDTMSKLRISLSCEPLVWLDKFRELGGLSSLLRIATQVEKKTP
jgi:hypothetical protein